jgi:protein-disulfide isomerase
VHDEYGDQVQLVFKQFPLANLHPNAPKAAEASLCAHELGGFWEIHDQMFEDQDNLAVSQVKEMAERLGLDREAFDTCLDGGRYVQQVQEEMSRGRSVGVTGTPALFLNGIPVQGGAVGFEALAEMIDKELARIGG